MKTPTTAPLTRFDVFVPGAFPAYSYVTRKFQNARTGREVDPEILIANALKQPGIIAQVVGPSKSGKTRAIENCVGIENLLTVAGSQLGQGVSLWDIVIRMLETPESSETAKSIGTKQTGSAKVSLSADVPLIASAEAELSAEQEKSREHERTLKFSVDPFQTATREIFRKQKVLFLDDFHTIPDASKSYVAAQLKAAAQLGVRICLAEVPHHSDSTISALPDLTARVQRIEFQYWNLQDLEQIGTVGFQILNAVISPASLAAFAMEAAGSPQLMQLVCLNAAANKKIDERLAELTSIQLEVDEIRTVLLETHSTVDRERIFKILDQGPDERGNPRNRYPVHALGEGDNYEIALAAISLSPPSTSLTWNAGTDNLLRRIDQICSSATDRPAKPQITRALEQMQTLAEKHMARQPIIEWSAITGLHILDPYFLFHLRWSEKYEKFRLNS